MNGPSIGPTMPIIGPMTGPPPPTMPPSPPHSNARSSAGSRLYSMSSNPRDTKKYSMQVMEGELTEHHRVLRAYLDQSLKEDKGYHPHNRARDKLLRLSAIQFQELSTDVYDELLRREDERTAVAAGANPSRIPRSLPAKPNFHPKRNQARQKLATLASRKFRELATDVCFELERRVPRIAASTLDRTGTASPTGSTASFGQRGPPNGRSRSSNGPNGLSVAIPPTSYGGRKQSVTSPPVPYSPALFDNNDVNTPASDYGRPTAKQFQSSTMVPTKGTMVEDDDDASDGASAYDVDSRHLSRASRRATAMSGVGRLRDSHFDSEQQTQILQLQRRVGELEEQIKQREDELSSAQSKADESVKAERSKSSSVLSDLERQVQAAEDLNANLKLELDQLRNTNNDMEARLQTHAASSGDTEELRTRNLELEGTAKDHEALREEYDALQNNHQRLQDEHGTLLNTHQEIQDGHRSLSDNHQQVREEHGLLLDDHHQLKDQLGSLEGKHEALQVQHEQLSSSHQQAREEHAGLLDDHQQIKNQLGSLEGRHHALQDQHERLLSEHDELQSNHANLGDNLDRVLGEHMQLKQQQQSNEAAEALQQQLQDLETRYNDREKAIEEVRQESSQTMQELRLLADQHDQGEEEREKLQNRISQLQEELVQWKGRYAKSKTALRSLKANSMVLSDQLDVTEPSQMDDLKTATGLVKDVHVTNYQTAINELIHLARSEDHTAAFNHMRSIVSTVGAIVRDVDAAAPSLPEESTKEHARLKRHVSKAMNNLVTTSKHVAGSNGLSPTSLIDAAASNLTAAVMAMIKVVKILPTPDKELQDSDDDTP